MAGQPYQENQWWPSPVAAEPTFNAGNAGSGTGTVIENGGSQVALPEINLFGGERFGGWECSSNPLQSMGLYAAQLLGGVQINNYSVDASHLVASAINPPTGLSTSVGTGGSLSIATHTYAIATQDTQGITFAPGLCQLPNGLYAAPGGGYTGTAIQPDNFQQAPLYQTGESTSATVNAVTTSGHQTVTLTWTVPTTGPQLPIGWPFSIYRDNLLLCTVTTSTTGTYSITDTGAGLLMGANVTLDNDYSAAPVTKAFFPLGSGQATAHQGGWHQVWEKAPSLRTLSADNGFGVGSSTPWTGNSIPARTGLALFCWGYFDGRTFGADANFGTTFQASLNAVISRWCQGCIMPYTDSSVTYSGSWGTEFVSGTEFSFSLGTGNSATISVPANFPGGTIAINMLCSALSGNCSVTLDGVPVGGSPFSPYNSALTDNSVASPFVVRIPNVTAGTHAILITNTGGGGGLQITTIESWGVEATTLPTMVVCNTTRNIINYGHWSDALAATVNGYIDTVAAGWKNVIVADIDSALAKNPHYFQADGDDPNELGGMVAGTVIAQAFNPAVLTRSW